MRICIHLRAPKTEHCREFYRVSPRLVRKQVMSVPKAVSIPFCVDRRGDRAMEATGAEEVVIR